LRSIREGRGYGCGRIPSDRLGRVVDYRDVIYAPAPQTIAQPRLRGATVLLIKVGNKQVGVLALAHERVAELAEANEAELECRRPVSLWAGRCPVAHAG
jgi:hypothetical protein